MGKRYPNPLETGMRFNFSFPLNMGRITCKYMRVENEDEEGKTLVHPYG